MLIRNGTGKSGNLDCWRIDDVDTWGGSVSSPAAMLAQPWALINKKYVNEKRIDEIVALLNKEFGGARIVS